ncbi:MAG: hypothetical protein AAGK22_22080 [Acidobacteriota bacterium]
MTYETLEIDPLIRHVGMEVRGLDLSRPLNEATKAELVDAFNRWMMLVGAPPVA